MTEENKDTIKKPMSEMTPDELQTYAKSLGAKAEKGMTKLELMELCSASLKEQAEVSVKEKELFEIEKTKEQQKQQEIAKQKALKEAAKNYAIEVGDFKLNPLGIQTIVEFKGKIFLIPTKVQDLKNQIERRLEQVLKGAK